MKVFFLGCIFPGSFLLRVIFVKGIFERVMSGIFSRSIFPGCLFRGTQYY